MSSRFYRNVLFVILLLTKHIEFCVAQDFPSPVIGDGNIGEIYISETFDSGALTNGWYDNTNIVVTNDEGALTPGALEYKYLAGSEYPIQGQISRHEIAATDQVYLRYFIKYGAGWVGSQLPFHPHEFYLLTNQDPKWQGPAVSHLTVYFEQNSGDYRVSMQDSKNIDASQVGVELSDVTENRAIAGCNGTTDGIVGTCYMAAGLYRNDKIYSTNSDLFVGNQGLEEWHLVEVFVKLNTLGATKANNDGVIAVWLNGNEVMNRSNILFRTNQLPNMKFDKFMIGPYIGGNGSPKVQSFWIDDITVAKGPVNFSEAVSPPSPPSNFNVSNN